MTITIIATNNTGSLINLDDIGVSLSSSEVRNLTNTFDTVELVESNDLYNNVASGDIGINDGIVDLSISDALAHINIESEYQDLEQDSDIGIDAMDLSVLGISNPTTWSIPNTYTDIPYPDTDIESNNDVIEHDGVNNDRVLIKEDGIYNITLSHSIRSNSGSPNSYFRTRKNDTDVIITERVMNTYGNEIHEHTDNITCNLLQGDFISSQSYVNPGDNISILYTNMKITKLEGIKGDDGAPGGTTVTVQYNDSDITTNTDTINFEGNSVSIVPESSNKATVIINDASHVSKYIQVSDSIGNINLNISTPGVYPFNQQDIRDVDTFDHSTVTNNSRLTTLKNGWFKISYQITYDSTSSSRKNIKTQLRKNGTTLLSRTVATSYTRNTTDDYGSNSLPGVLIHLTSGDYIELMFNREGSSGAVNSYNEQCWLQIEFCRED